MEEGSTSAGEMDKDVSVTNVSEGSADFVRIKQEVDLPEDDTFYPMDFGISVEDEEEMNPVYVKMKSKQPGSSEHSQARLRSTAAKGRGKAKSQSIAGRKSLRARATSQRMPQPVTYVESSEEEEYMDSLKVSRNAGGGGNRPKKGTVRSDLSREEEENMVEWLQGTECLYNRQEMKYRDVQMKHKLWADKAKEMGKKVNVLKVWYKSIRTRYVRLSKKASRFGMNALTARDRWVVKRFAFLAEHIVKGRSRTRFTDSGLPKKSNAASRAGSTSHAAVLYQDNDDEEPGGTEKITLVDYYKDLPTPPSPGPGLGPSSKGRTSAHEGEGEANVLGITQRSEQFIQMQERVLMSMLQPRAVNERTTYADWMKVVIEGFDKPVWREFQYECSQLIHKYQCRNDQVLTAQQSQPSTSREAVTREQSEDRNQYSLQQQSSDTVRMTTNAFPEAVLRDAVGQATDAFPEAVFPDAVNRATNAFLGQSSQIQ